MLDYKETMNLYFELKGTPESSRESYLRRLKAFAEFIQDKGLEEITLRTDTLII
jgi:predicted phosphoadenosine phosphosulfate sulfurtransferase